MKVWDIFKISLHNMWNNKLRTLLVMVVLVILSILVISIISLAVDMTGAVNTLTASDKSALSIIMRYDDVRYSGGIEDGKITEKDVENIYDYFNTHRDLFSAVIFKTNYGITRYVDPTTNITYKQENPIVSGRLYNTSDIGKKHCWITKEYAIDHKLAVGDIVSDYEVNGYEVVGIINTNKSMYERDGIYLLMSEIPNPDEIQEVCLMGYEGQSLDIFTLMNIAKFTKDNTKSNYNKGISGIAYRSDKALNAQFNIYIELGVIGGSIFLSLIVMLLSIGCVSNSIEITVEQNRKFFGVMKAVGLRNKTVKQIVRWQAVVMIVLTVAIASGIVSGILYGLKPMIAQSLQLPIDAFVFSIPVFVPFLIAAMLIILVMISTKKSLNKISKMDVVSVISEVN